MKKTLLLGLLISFMAIASNGWTVVLFEEDFVGPAGDMSDTLGGHPGGWAVQRGTPPDNTIKLTGNGEVELLATIDSWTEPKLRPGELFRGDHADDVQVEFAINNTANGWVSAGFRALRVSNDNDRQFLLLGSSGTPVDGVNIQTHSGGLPGGGGSGVGSPTGEPKLSDFLWNVKVVFRTSGAAEYYIDKGMGYTQVTPADTDLNTYPRNGAEGYTWEIGVRSANEAGAGVLLDRVVVTSPPENTLPPTVPVELSSFVVE